MLAGVPNVVLVGQTMTAERAATYAQIIEGGVFPALPPAADEPSMTYLKRCAEAFARSHRDNRFQVSFVPYASHDFDDGHNGDIDRRNPVTAVFTPLEHHLIDGVPLERALAKHRRFCAELIGRLCTATHFSFNVFGPSSAQDAAEYIYFNWDAREWWSEQTYEAASDLGIDAEQLTNLQIRQFLRKNEIRTPGQMRRALGAHHRGENRWSARKKRRPASARKVRLPARVRRVVTEISKQIDVLACVGAALKRLMREDDYQLIQGFAHFPQPGATIETTSTGTVSELLEDLWQDVSQSGVFAPAFGLVLDATPQSARRLNRAIGLLTEASRCMRAIEGAFTAFNRGKQ